jgi:hypothetical protein
MPFQHTIVKIAKLWSTTGLATFFNRLDEFTIIIFFPIAAIVLYRNNKILNGRYLSLFLPIFALGVVGFTSGILNANPLLTTVHGIFDYVKYFLVLFIYIAFFREYSEFKRLFHILLIVAIFLGAIAFIQETWALGNRYVLQRNINTDIFYLNLTSFINPQAKQDYFELWRFGILRVSSLMINSNVLGLYMLLMLVIYTQIVKKVNFAVFIPLFSGIFGSVSRVTYMSFLLLGGIQIFRGKKWWVFPLIPVVIILFYLSPLPDYIKSKSIFGKLLKTSIETVEIHEVPRWTWDAFRVYTREKAIEIWKDHILLGAGPGMYGGGISLKYKSPIYEEYKFDPTRRFFLEHAKTIDQFWPQVLAELGVTGVACVMSFFLSLAINFYKLKKNTFYEEVKGLYRGLIIYLVIVLIYSFGYEFNIPPIIFTYFAMVGMAFGIKSWEEEISI